ncbi:MAG TPA: hypothetical protein VFF30_03095 [Nitrososphaerales archaeon]|nr:hypothetical protein [Nitrososphaerales archaeon]
MYSRLFSVASLTALIVLLSSAGIAYADNSAQPQMVGSQWAVYEQVTLPNGNLNFYPAAHASTIPSGGVEFSMPNSTSSSPAYVNYLLNTYTTSLTESNTITAVINVVTSSSATTFVGNPDGGNPAVSFVRLFVQSNLPNDHSSTCTGRGNVNNYWWADPASGSYTFGTGGSGPVTLSIPLNPADWSNICGQFGTSNTAAFDSALANIKFIGLSFGSYYFFANGMGVDGTTGTATFQLVSYTIS